MDPPYPEEFLQSQEYLGEAKVTEKQAAERVGSILVNRMHLDSRGFKFGVEAQFTHEPNPNAARGMRRFVFEWPPAWATEAMKPRDVTPASIIAEVDAVSGDVKSLLFRDTIFDGDGWAKLGFP